MSTPYLGEIRMVGFNFAPVGWAMCDGSVLLIPSNEALFNLLGTTYGGDGRQTFALPDLRGRIPFHQGNSLVVGASGGSETVTLVQNQLPTHTHALSANSSSGTQGSPTGGFWAQSSLGQYSTETPTLNMAAAAVSSTGGSLPHDNIPPFLAITFIIALQGVYPSQN